MKKILSLALALAFAVFASAHAQTWSTRMDTNTYRVLQTSLQSPTTITNPVSLTIGKPLYVNVKPNGGSGVSQTIWLANGSVSGTTLVNGAVSSSIAPDVLVQATDGSYTIVPTNGAQAAGVRLKFLAGSTESVSITVTVPK